MSAEAEPGPSDSSKADRGKGVATHSRHVSIDENPHSAGRLRASSSPFTASPLPSRWPTSDAASKYPPPDESKSSENSYSHQSSQSFSSIKANNHPPATPIEASSSSAAKGNKEGESSNARLEEANETAHVREKPRIDHRRRLSSKSHASPRQSSNYLDHPGQSPEDPTRSMLSLSFYTCHLTIKADIAQKSQATVIHSMGDPRCLPKCPILTPLTLKANHINPSPEIFIMEDMALKVFHFLLQIRRSRYFYHRPCRLHSLHSSLCRITKFLGCHLAVMNSW